MVCKDCVLKLHYPDKAIPIDGYGSIKYKRIMILPYTHKSGISNSYWYQVVKDLMESCSIDIGNFFVTSIVKCVVSNGLNDYRHTICNTCKHNLRNDYNLVKPNIVLLLGAETVYNILGTTVKNARNNIQVINDISYVCTYASKDKMEDIEFDIKRFCYALMTGDVSNYNLIT